MIHPALFVPVSAILRPKSTNLLCDLPCLNLRAPDLDTSRADQSPSHLVSTTIFAGHEPIAIFLDWHSVNGFMKLRIKPLADGYNRLHTGCRKRALEVTQRATQAFKVGLQSATLLRGLYSSLQVVSHGQEHGYELGLLTRRALVGGAIEPLTSLISLALQRRSQLFQAGLDFRDLSFCLESSRFQLLNIRWFQSLRLARAAAARSRPIGLAIHLESPAVRDAYPLVGR